MAEQPVAEVRLVMDCVQGDWQPLDGGAEVCVSWHRSSDIEFIGRPNEGT